MSTRRLRAAATPGKLGKLTGQKSIKYRQGKQYHARPHAYRRDQVAAALFILQELMYQSRHD
ncbi:hypothetical protein [Janthinobacterium rivuli]|uniref:hypothetical protein n=1 Tax=Janthinobacterium rivuli TaxID=2751478 RepID=UPI00383A39FC